MKKNIFEFTLVLFVILFVFVTVSHAQTKTHTLSDYGLTPDQVKYLTPAEIQQILNSKTPAETIASGESIFGSHLSSSSVPTPSLTNGSLNSAVNCFDYYHFGSVQTNISSNSINAVPGMTMNFSGLITNQNSYPIVNGRFYVKIFRTKGLEKDSNGPDVVDQFVVADNITIPAGGVIPTAFSWKVPSYVKSGAYQVASFFVVDSRFNLLGLSFTDDVVGNTFDFNISGGQQGVQFDKTSVTINNQPYFFAAYPPQIATSTPAVISATIDNGTKTDQTVSVTWSLYRWDSMNPSNLVRTISTSTTVKAQSTTPISITIFDNDAAVYYLVGKLTYKDTSSILGIRFIRPGVDNIRLNFPSITQFPLEKNATSTMFSCVYNGGTADVVSGGVVKLNLVDDTSSTTIASYEYDGSITGDMMAIKKDFISPQTLDHFSLHANLYQNGKLIDQAVMKYDCNTIDPKSCNPIPRAGLLDSSIVWFIVGIIIIILILFIILKLKGRGTKTGTLIILALLLPAFYFVSPSKTEAASVQWNSGNVAGPLNYFYNNGGLYGLPGNANTGWEEALSNWNISISYSTQILNSDTGAVLSIGDSIPVGTHLALKFIPHAYTDISWFGTGYSDDSPYGEWRANAAPPASLSCNTKDFVNNIHDELTLSINIPNLNGNPSWINIVIPRNYDVYIPLVISPPTETITNTDGLICGSLTGNETDGYAMQCTVANAGILSPKFNFSGTSGQFYYRYYDKSGNQPAGCYANNISLAGYGNIINESSEIGQPQASYSVNVPAQTIAYNLTATPAVASNNPPSSPDIKEIDGITPTLTGTTYNFTASSTDPDGDQITYNFDWNSSDVPPVINQTSGSASPSGTYFPVGLPKSWSTPGTYAFKVQAVDSHGATSSWSTYLLTLTNPPSNKTLTTAIQGVGSGNVTSNVTGNSTNINCSTGNTGTCSADFPDSTNVILTETTSSGIFGGWSDNCTPIQVQGGNSCSVTMDSAKTVTATFDDSSGNGISGQCLNIDNNSSNVTVNTGDSTTFHVGTITGGSGSYDYYWNDSSTATSSTSPNLYVETNEAYHVKVIDQNNTFLQGTFICPNVISSGSGSCASPAPGNYWTTCSGPLPTSANTPNVLDGTTCATPILACHYYCPAPYVYSASDGTCTNSGSGGSNNGSLREQ